MVEGLIMCYRYISHATSSLNDLRAILLVLAAEKHGCDVYIYTFNDPSIVLTYIMLTVSCMRDTICPLDKHQSLPGIDDAFNPVIIFCLASLRCF